MSDSKDSDSKESGEYEDDFEKDLEWLINEKEQNDGSLTEVICKQEEDINQELKENDTEKEHNQQLSDSDTSIKDEGSARRNDFISVPSIQPLDALSDSDSENSFQDSRPENQKDHEEDEDEEVKRYIMEKIIQANNILQNQEPTSSKRERKLKFKDKLVDLEVPPLDNNDIYRNSFENENNMSGKLSQLYISNELEQENVILSLPDRSCEENKDGKILIERDGKFELLNLQDIESQGFLPPINSAISIENEPQQLLLRSPNSCVNGVKKDELAGKSHAITHLSTGEPLAYVPQPPSNHKSRPSSAANLDRNKGNRKSHRTQSANISPVTSTYCLSPRQKELQKQLEQRREKLKREEEQRKIEEEKEKKKENDMVFKAWLQKKREQVLEMRRIQRAKQIEYMNNRANRDPQLAFRLWLKKKHDEQMKERKSEELRKQEECLFFLQGTEGRERAFKQWLRRKRIEKIAEQQAVKERARQLRLEARRTKHIQNHLYTMSEAKAFRFTDQYN
ncbi:coiled-coil domain-containing protein 181 isoform X2 [Perognathus longimembris pacificus]|uniref:coiled-coil domain-containing protein 181 isoform X2 n=1 Tax=Perognathus longimembris pacificus TaxID=214514 RepID=UPI00201940EC|nr:coiled-coil domain-containing protein 181 isoform X2 [Perognathus longimembris pacificus]